MSIFDALKTFSSTSVNVACPECSFATMQLRSKIRNNTTLICPKCGHFFLPREPRAKKA
ncbi:MULTISPECIES: YnfU family zinc-binding protein [Brenneria]|uniref:YnfU family zinc-binding protein n=1 Tax=Brenneria TaxID=71655 RepID=UPI001E452503|nr:MULTISPECIES: YnfU family zinc-binding protein [Brenneria]